MKAVRQYGLEGVRIQNISDLAGLTPGALYRYFKSKDELMTACFYYVDRQVAALYDHYEPDPALLASDPAAAVKTLWQPYFHFWRDRPDETVFYHRFRDSASFPDFDKTRDISYFSNFLGITDRFMRALPDLKQLDCNLLSMHMIAGTVHYAKFVAEGLLPNTLETEDVVFQLLVSGLTPYLTPIQSE